IAFETKNRNERRTPEEMLELQQISILQCLRWISESERTLLESYRGSKPNRIQRQFEESMIRMNTQGVKATDDFSSVAKNNLARLDSFMSRDILRPVTNERFQEYRSLYAKFSLHIREQI
ncbi:MAG: hypothetical protein MH219_20840, partial [Marinobacter sp.]|nr:hypothetical protein [Marinobacter sp.]